MSLPAHLTPLLERLAGNVHDIWARERLALGWRYGPRRDDERKEHPSLVPYDQLSDEEKAFDRQVATGTVKTLAAFGCTLSPPRGTSMDTFDEYKFFAHSTHLLTERRQAATQIYLSVNTAIFAVFGIFVERVRGVSPELLAISAPLIAMGLATCLVWYRTLRHYRRLVAWRYDQLMAMEQEDAMSGSRRWYTHEWKECLEPLSGGSRISFSDLESWLPRLFALIYVSYLVALLVLIARPV